MTKREQLLQDTIAEWQKDYKETLTAQDAEEIIANVTAYFRLLDKWAQEEDSKGAEGGQERAASPLVSGERPAAGPY